MPPFRSSRPPWKARRSPHRSISARPGLSQQEVYYSIAMTNAIITAFARRRRMTAGRERDTEFHADCVHRNPDGCRRHRSLSSQLRVEHKRKRANIISSGGAQSDRALPGESVTGQTCKSAGSRAFVWQQQSMLVRVAVQLELSRRRQKCYRTSALLRASFALIGEGRTSRAGDEAQSAERPISVPAERWRPAQRRISGDRARNRRPRDTARGRRDPTEGCVLLSNTIHRRHAHACAVNQATSGAYFIEYR